MNIDLFDALRFAMEFAVVPAVALLWKISNEIHSLRLAIAANELNMADKYVKKSELKQLVFGVNGEPK